MSVTIPADTYPVPPAEIVARVRLAIFAVPAVALAAGALALSSDPRLALLSVAFILGWTRLVGL